MLSILLAALLTLPQLVRRIGTNSRWNVGVCQWKHVGRLVSITFSIFQRERLSSISSYDSDSDPIACIFTSYGGFWLSFALITLPFTGIQAAYVTGTGGGVAELEHAVGFYVLGWGIFTFVRLWFNFKKITNFRRRLFFWPRYDLRSLL